MAVQSSTQQTLAVSNGKVVASAMLAAAALFAKERHRGVAFSSFAMLACGQAQQGIEEKGDVAHTTC